jgi:hypothetical protein
VEEQVQQGEHQLLLTVVLVEQVLLPQLAAHQ